MSSASSGEMLPFDSASESNPQPTPTTDALNLPGISDHSFTYPPAFAAQFRAFIFGLILLVIVTWLDWLSGRDIHLGFLYWMAVVLCAWTGGRWPGYAMTIISTPLWMRFSEPFADFQAGWHVVAANVGAHLIYYPVLIEVAFRLRTEERRLDAQVTQRTAALKAEIAERERTQASLTRLASQLSEAEDAERRRIAYDIHDGLSQNLTVVKLNLETAVVESAIDSRQFERLTDMVKLVDDLIRQTRDMTFDLHPSLLEDLGLVPTLMGFADEFHRRTQSQLIVNELGERKQIANSLASYLFRALKELVNNSVKHGNATEIIVTVHWSDSSLRIVVDDDGTGFEPKSAPVGIQPRGLGLPGIIERLSSLGGGLKVESQPGQGTRVIIQVPVSK